MIALPPLSLYIHVPWCVRKCPYCDFNSHEAAATLPEADYVQALLADMQQDAGLVQGRRISSVFIGGGTPSMFSAQAYRELFSGLRQQLDFSDDVEITLEANPGTVEQEKFSGYRDLGINRLSIGVQSFDPVKLKTLGRIHGREEALQAAEAAQRAGFDNFNLDLMHGLPGQTVVEAVADLQQAIALRPTHLSWYQLTIEPNTVFYRDAPVLPEDDALWSIQEAGQALLAEHGYQQYEVSAYAQAGRECRHNRNYWEFGDYLAIGAGAHGKITRADGVLRYAKTRLPRDYLAARRHGRFTATSGLIAPGDLVFEFMLNALRLREGVPAVLFEQRTGLSLDVISAALASLRRRDLLQKDESRLQCTPAGFNYLNQVLNVFLP
ncbi:MAG: radical SAM family heme chaperone HemW [bacterium]|nr:radical SAM family heme chaperone HemW [bacterium]